jgi:predicted DNA-binding mobile mystery protein A
MQEPFLLIQTDQKLRAFAHLDKMPVPERGWIHTIRCALKMSLRQLGNKLEITPQSAKEIELREANEAITLKSLREAGNAMDLKLVYGFVPKDGSLEELVERRALEIAMSLIHDMPMPDDDNPGTTSLSTMVKSKALEIKHKMPKYLWDV